MYWPENSEPPQPLTSADFYRIVPDARLQAVCFIIVGVGAERVLQTVNVTPRTDFKFDFPILEESLADVLKLRGMLDLEKVIVIVGFAEVGPWGSSRTR